MQVVVALSSSMYTSEISEIVKLPDHKIEAMLEQNYQRQKQFEEEQEFARLKLWAQIYEEEGIRKYEIAQSTAEKLLAENVDLDYIAKVTSWGVNQIKALQYQIQKDLVKVFTASLNYKNRDKSDKHLKISIQ